MPQPVWNTLPGSLGNFPIVTDIQIQLQASPVTPATSLTYSFLSGSFPDGIQLNSQGLIYGLVTFIDQDTTYNFAVRVTDNLGNIRDRTFSLTILGSAVPYFLTPPGTLLSTNDSVWVELPVEYVNPDANYPVTVRLTSGSLPLGLELNEFGLIRGYASPPNTEFNFSATSTTATFIDNSNIITCLSTTNFVPGRQVTFSGASIIGGLTLGTTYYIKNVLGATSFTVSASLNGPELILVPGAGFMTVFLPPQVVGQPVIKTYEFELILENQLGSNIESYAITVINQNTPISQGGPGRPQNTRIPTILNTRPETFNLNTTQYYGYYIVPNDNGYTYSPGTPAYIGTINSGDFFAFKILGYDFDGNNLTYEFANLPLGLSGDPITGWITGSISLLSNSFNQYQFSVSVYKTSNSLIRTPFFNFSINVSNNLSNIINWITTDNLGAMFNGELSTKKVLAEANTPLLYRITSGALPPNLEMTENGEIMGRVAMEPTSSLLSQGTITNFEFTVEAYSPAYPIINSTKTFTITVNQEFSQPTDILYIKANPSIEDRELVGSLLNNQNIIPNEFLYRPDDDNFGKATNVTYEHAYGIYASDIGEYLAAVTQNHYWRYITLGEIKTAVARNDDGEIIYEVVYSQIIDNLTNSNGISIPQQVNWPRPINLNLGPWYTSITNIFTSYGQTVTQNYYTSLTPGSVQTLYPNSLINMRNRVAQVLGQEYNSKLLPLWMTSQQINGGTLGFTPAWVICYTLPGKSSIIKNNIETLWKKPDQTPCSLNQINFEIDRFSVNKSQTYNYDKNTVPPAWIGLPSATPVPDPMNSKDFYVLFPRKTILPN